MIEFERLRSLIGLTVWHDNTCCHVIEVLEDGLQVVLQCESELSPIQGNQFGEARRRVPQTVTIDVLYEGQLSPAFSALRVVP